MEEKGEEEFERMKCLGGFLELNEVLVSMELGGVGVTLDNGLCRKVFMNGIRFGTCKGEQVQTQNLRSLDKV